MYEGFENDWVKFHRYYLSTYEALDVLSWFDNVDHDKYKKNFSKEDSYEKVQSFIGGMEGIKHFFQHLINMYCYAKAASDVAEEIDNEGYKNYWSLIIRNYHIYDFIPKYFSFLDASAYFVVSLTFGELLQGTKLEKGQKSYYGEVWPILNKTLKDTKDIGFLTQKDRKIFLKYLRDIDIEQLNPKQNELFRKFRNESTHKMFLGIDYMTQFIVPFFPKNSYKATGYGFLAGPRYKFDQIELPARNIIKQIDEAIPQIFTTDIYAYSIDSNESKNT